MREIEYIKAVTEALDEEMERDKDVFLIGEDIGQYGGVFGATKGLYRKYGPERVKQTPISESAIIGAAMGAAITGLRPVAEIMYFDFISKLYFLYKLSINFDCFRTFSVIFAYNF